MASLIAKRVASRGLTARKSILTPGEATRWRCSNQYFTNGKLRLLHTSSVRAKVIPFYLSDIGEGIREVNVKEWFVKVGDDVKQFDNICEVQSDKASVTITSRFDGKITKLYHDIDSLALVGHPLVDIDVEDGGDAKAGVEVKTDKTEPVKVNEAAKEDPPEDVSSNRSKVLATPAVRRIAMQNKLNLTNVMASGKGGRVLKEDILNHLNINSEDSNNVAIMKKIENNQKVAARPPAPKTVEIIGEDKLVPLNNFTKAMVKTMTTALKIPHFGYSDEIDVTQLVSIRERTKVAALEAGVKLTFMPFFIKAASLALSKYPVINSSIDENCENVLYKAAHNIGVAMDTSNGLIVPNIKNVQHKNIIQIAGELNRLQQAGVNGTFKLDDLTGGTFSLSNIGIIGGTYTKPVILAPQVAIGALGKIQVLPRFDENDQVIKAHIVCVSWSADHRIIDGVTMAKFSNQWKFYVENPSHLMLGL